MMSMVTRSNYSCNFNEMIILSNTDIPVIEQLQSSKINNWNFCLSIIEPDNGTDSSMLGCIKHWSHHTVHVGKQINSIFWPCTLTKGGLDNIPYINCLG
jgi:hypothetical protein